jgi:hypothetical protein
MTIVKLTKKFGEFNFQCICEIYYVMIDMVDSILYGPHCIIPRVASFLDFVRVIEGNVTQGEDIRLLLLLFEHSHVFGFDGYKIVESFCLGPGLAED